MMEIVLALMKADLLVVSSGEKVVVKMVHEMVFCMGV
jgi:hypothetical protein